MNKTFILISGISGIILTLSGTIMMFSSLKFDLTKLYKIEDDKLQGYTGRDAYLNLRQQIIDAIKHENKIRSDELKTSYLWLWVIGIGSLLQAISLAASVIP